MDKLANEFHKLTGIPLNKNQLSAFSRYEKELEIWNSRHSLTAIRKPEDVRVKHFLDSLSAYLALRGSKMTRIIDVGTGAGFPGIPLKILCPAIHLTLVESVAKKAAFCEHIVQALALENVEVLQIRAEQLGQDSAYREKFDWAIARAVAVMPVLVEYLLPLVRVGGKALAMKGDNAPAEAHSADGTIQMLGGHLRQLMPVILPGVVETRHLVVIDKIAATPEKYPRREGIPTKRPLAP
jgi:16S rRNA (guanine527-N7)-methyltransferase